MLTFWMPILTYIRYKNIIWLIQVDAFFYPSIKFHSQILIL